MKGQFVLACLGLIAGIFDAHASPVRCPVTAPGELAAGKVKLSEVRVLSVDDKSANEGNEALPIIAPDREIRAGSQVRQVWKVNMDSPRHSYYVDCIYGEQVHRIKLPSSVALCTATDDQRLDMFSLTCR